MDYAAALAALEAAKLENGEDVISAIKEKVTAVGKESQGLRTKLRAAETEGTKAKDALTTTLSRLGIELKDGDDLETALDEGIKTLSAKKGDGKETDAIAALRSDFDRKFRTLEKGKQDAEEKLKTETGKRHSVLAASSVHQALVAQNALKPGVIKDLLIGKAKVSDGDAVVFLNDDGTETDVEAGVKAFLAANPEFQANRAAGGSGGGGTGSGGGNASKNFTKEQIGAMDQASFEKNVAPSLLDGSGALK